jgi:hypothetical protein
VEKSTITNQKAMTNVESGVKVQSKRQNKKRRIEKQNKYIYIYICQMWGDLRPHKNAHAPQNGAQHTAPFHFERRRQKRKKKERRAVNVIFPASSL